MVSLKFTGAGAPPWRRKEQNIKRKKEKKKIVAARAPAGEWVSHVSDASKQTRRSIPNGDSATPPNARA